MIEFIYAFTIGTILAAISCTDDMSRRTQYIAIIIVGITSGTLQLIL